MSEPAAAQELALEDDEHAELRQTYSPIWAAEEAASTARWRTYLAAKAGDRPVGSDAEGAALAAKVLPPLLPAQVRPIDANNELDVLVLGGIPGALRGNVWPVLLRMDTSVAAGYYEQLVQVVQAEGTQLPANTATAPASPPDPEAATEAAAAAAAAAAATASPEAPSTASEAASTSTPAAPQEKLSAWRAQARTWLGQIDKDVHRTFPDRMDAAGRASLRRLLAAFTLHDPSTGYCQGMNFVAGGLLLLIGNEATAFGCLAAVVSDVLPGFYSPAMVALQVDQQVFVHLVGQHLPALSQHLANLGVAPGNVIAQWFLCAFVTVLPFEVASRVWDVLFYERCTAVLFRVALALMEIYSAALEAAVDVLDASDLMQNMGALTYDASRLLDVSVRSFGSVTPAAVQLLQQRFRDEVVAQMEASRRPKPASTAATPAPATPAAPATPTAVMPEARAAAGPRAAESCNLPTAAAPITATV